MGKHALSVEAQRRIADAVREHRNFYQRTRRLSFVKRIEAEESEKAAKLTASVLAQPMEQVQPSEPEKTCEPPEFFGVEIGRKMSNGHYVILIIPDGLTPLEADAVCTLANSIAIFAQSLLQKKPKHIKAVTLCSCP